MTIATIKGQFVKGQVQKIKKPNAQKMALHGIDMPSLGIGHKVDGHFLNRTGAI